LPVPATRSELLDELELATQGGSAEKRLQTLGRVTDLFLGGADCFRRIGFCVGIDVSASESDCED
jgi:hypothetical protein